MVEIQIDRPRPSPFEWIARPAQGSVFAAMVFLSLLVGAALQVLSGPLTTEAARRGIVSFEIAGDLSRAQEIITSWGADGRVRAALNTGLDFLFIPLYVGAIGLGSLLVAERLAARSNGLYRLGFVLCWAQLLAGALDVLENIGLIRVLLGTQRAFWPALARWSAIPKFVIVGAGIAYILVGAVGLLFMNKSERR
jgi:hypothetical protein